MYFSFGYPMVKCEALNESSSDLPLLSNMRSLAKRFLASLLPAETAQTQNSDFRIGFITPPFKDNKIPITDHLHAHAFIGNPDLAGWWRGFAYSPISWYAIDDLIAEIR